MHPSQVHNQWHLAPHGAVQTPPPSSSRTFSLSQRKPCTHGLPLPAPAPGNRSSTFRLCGFACSGQGSQATRGLHVWLRSTRRHIFKARPRCGECQCLAPLWVSTRPPHGCPGALCSVLPYSHQAPSLWEAARTGICWVPCWRARAHRVLAALGGGSRHRPPSRTRVTWGARAGLDPASGSGVHALASAAAGWEKDRVLGLLGSRMCDGYSSKSPPPLTYSNM